MIDRLQRKFVIITMLLVSILLTVILFCICLFLYIDLRSQMFTSLKNAVSYVESWEEKEVEPESEPPLNADVPESPVKPSDLKKMEYAFEYSYISVISYDTKTQSMKVILQNNALEDSILKNATQSVISTKESSGVIPAEKLFYYSTRYENGLIIAYSATTNVTSALTRYLLFILCAEGSALIIIFFASIYLSRLAMQPVIKVMEEQKRFIADASHELKTPLTVIMANNSILLSHKDTPICDQLNWIESSNNEIQHMNRLISDMLILAKSESGIIEKSFDPVDLSELVMQTVLQFEAIAYEKNLSVSDEIQDHIHMNGNKMLLRQLIMVLLDNAVKYEKEGGSIKVSLSKRKDKIILSVQNTKTCMNTEAIEHAFDRFYRADQVKTNRESFGLGLSIAKSITEQHFGKISVDSDQKNGTTFHVIF